MGRLFSLRNIIGVLLAFVLAPACVLVLARMTLPASVAVVVASQDLKPGDAISLDNVHEEDWMQVNPLSASNMVLVSQADQVLGGRVAYGQSIPSGHPISLSQVVFDKKLNDQLSRVTLLAAQDKVVVPIDMLPGQVGNWIKPDDYVDLIFTVGQIPQGDIPIPSVQPPANPIAQPGATPQAPLPGLPLAQATPGSVQFPLATVPLTNVHVLRVDYAEKSVFKTTSSGQQVNATVQGDVQRIYVELTPTDATVVGFLLQSGKVLAASHKAPLVGPSQMVGLTWTDFVNWFMSHRPDMFARGTQPTPVKTTATK